MHRPAISIEHTEPMPPPGKGALDGDKDLSFDKFGNSSTELIKEQWGFLIPKYDSMSVFLMAITWILVLLTNPKSTNRLSDFLSHFPTKYPVWNTLMAYLALFAIIGLCFYMVLSGRYKTDVEKKLMAVFAAITTIVTAYACWIYLKKSHQIIDWRIIFPLWNIFNARILLQMLISGVINEDCVGDRQPSLLQVFLGLTAVITIFIFCNYKFDMYWAVTFSICIAYTISFDKALQSVFPGLSGGEVKS
jgi:hypothetical protein